MKRRFKPRAPRDPNKPPDTRTWWVYVIQSQELRFGKRGNPLPGFHYVGCTTDPARRILEHNGLKAGGAKYTAKHRPWLMCALYGPYTGQSEALKAERALKHGKRGVARTQWTPEDSPWYRGLGTSDPRVAEINGTVSQ